MANIDNSSGMNNASNGKDVSNMATPAKSVADYVRENPNCNYFISASAGTGKTYTLTSYYLGILEHYERTGEADIVDKILAVTFTNKAANEMKERIMDEVRKKLDSMKPNNASYVYWREVYKNLSRAVISTIDSFCRRILVEQNVQAGVDPSFTIITELKQMRVIENASRTAIEIAFKIFDDEEPLLPPGIMRERKDKMDGYIYELKQLKSSIKDIFELIGDIQEVQEHVANIVRNWRLELSNSDVSDKLMKVLEKGGKSLKVLRLIALIASELYESETIDNFEYDFKGVLEKTFSVLQQPEIRAQYQGQFRYIIVDEFQDTNDLQKKIFNLIHSDNNFLFYVGDRKQSIYRFRGADVSVFLSTMEEFEQNARQAPDKYKVLSLQTNYRSHQKLVEYFNEISEKSIFNNVIYESAKKQNSGNRSGTGRSTKGNKNSQKAQEENTAVYRYEVFKLRFPELYKKMWFLAEDRSDASNQGSNGESIPNLEFSEEISRKPTERVVYLNVDIATTKENGNGKKENESNSGSEENTESIEKSNDRGLDGYEQEAILVAKTIKSLVGKEMTFYEKENGTLRARRRKIEYKDFTILTYKLQGVEEYYREVFSKFGIPLYVVNGRGFYKRPEIRSVMSAMTAIQNPNSDYNFANFFFTPFLEDVDSDSSDFQKFKIFHKIIQNRNVIQEAMKKETSKRPSLFQSAKELAKNGELPKHVADMILLLQKYDELKYFLRPAEVLKDFVKESDYVRKIALFDNSDQKLKNVKKLLDQAAEFNHQANTFLELTRMLQKIDELQETEASEISEEDNVVRMMTVHGSKGLEFNIVFLVNNDFSEKDEEKVFFPLAENGTGRYIYIKKFLDKLKDNLENEFDVSDEDFKELMKELEAEIVYDETELLRKLYVAITRAREMLFIVTVPGKDKNSSKKFINPSELSSEKFSRIDLSPSQIEDFFNEVIEENEVKTEKTVQTIDEETEKSIEKQISDLTNMAYKRYISPTLLYNIVDEKSDFEAFDENFNDFESEMFTRENAQSPQSEEVEIPNVFSNMLETSPELLEGKIVHRKISSVTEYNQLIYLVERGDLPRGILNAEILKRLFEGSQKVLSEWRIAKDMEENGKSYVLFGVPDKVFFKDGKIYVVDFKHSELNRQQELDKYRFQVQFYMYLLADFGEIGGGYLISSKNGKVIEIERPNDDFINDVKRRIDRFLEVVFV